MKLRIDLGVVALVLPLVSAGCGDDEQQQAPPAACSVSQQTGCGVGLACEEVEGGEPACYAPVIFKGRVFDLVEGTQGIAGARVVARDANDAVGSSVAITAADGSYELAVPARRDSAGVPLHEDYTLRADASGYDSFPKAPRIALPIDVATATGAPPVLQTAATDIGLVALPNATSLGSISGKISGAAGLGDELAPGGALVVAGGSTGVADRAGDYVVYNVAAGSAVEVRGYAAGLAIDPTTATVSAGQETPGINLTLRGAATARVSGKVSIVNGGDGDDTSIVLAVDETFNENAARGEVPRGLRVGGVSGDWSIGGVPDGRYVVLAAFENDDLVRDVSGIGGTALVRITVAGSDMALDESFKVTGALAVESPGASGIEEVTGTPTFVWEDDSSEDGFELRVFDALGALTWEDLAVPSVSGSKSVSLEYGGEPLTPGMIYQFRVSSIKDGNVISSTEDLKGVFIAR